MVLTHREIKIICDGCDCDLTDYESYITASKLRKQNNVIRINGLDYCPNCNPNKS